MSRITGGNPAGMPDFRPMNPHGRPMPKAKPKLAQERLYQVVAERTSDGQLVRLGPMIGKEVAEHCCEALSRNIIRGLEKDYANPTVVAV